MSKKNIVSKGREIPKEKEKFDLNLLPPLPIRDKSMMIHENIIGWIIVANIITVLVGVTHGVALTYGKLPPPVWWTACILIYSEAFISVCCLIGICVTNPGEIRRSDETCRPIPEEISRRLKKKEPIRNMSNLPNTEGTKTYCVRCFVWREKKLKPHHCRHCNRCVLYFDHHCSIFGRCIAGSAMGFECCSSMIRYLSTRPRRKCIGNMPYFITLIVMAYAGFFTCAGFTTFSLMYKFATQ